MKKLITTIAFLSCILFVNAQWYTQTPTQKSSFGYDVTVSPFSLFDLKVTNDDLPLFFDEELINGAAASTHSVEDAQVTLQTDSITEAIIRQTYQRAPYQPGKGQRIYFTGVLEPTNGTIKRYGYYNSSILTPFSDSLDGVYFKTSSDTMYVCAAQNGTENCIAQSSWNIDRAVDIDWSKAQVFYMSFGWLGYRGVEFGITDGSRLRALHSIDGTNNTTTPFMSSPNHSIRAELRQVKALAGTNTLVMGCQSVQSDGGIELAGTLKGKSTQGSEFTLATEDSTYALYGIRLKDGYRDAVVVLRSIELLIGTASDLINYQIWLNPPITGTFTYTDEPNSAVQIATGTGTTYVLPGGTLLNNGFAFSGTAGGGGAGAAGQKLENALRIGVAIDGTEDYIVISGTPVSGAANVGLEVAFEWREF